MMRYRIRRTASEPSFTGAWSSGVWAKAESLEIASFHPRSSDHRPFVQAKLLFDDRFLYVFFRVQDRYVRAVSTHFQDPVWADSCVELFVRPNPEEGYFNFEMNCIGALLLYYIEDPTITPDGFVKYTKLEERDIRDMRFYHSLPDVVDPEITEPTEWVVEYRIPFSLFAAYLRSPVNVSGASWRGNLNKCADGCSHPHWASWSPIGEELNFHQPERFGTLSFDR